MHVSIAVFRRFTLTLTLYYISVEYTEHCWPLPDQNSPIFFTRVAGEIDVRSDSFVNLEQYCTMNRLMASKCNVFSELSTLMLDVRYYFRVPVLKFSTKILALDFYTNFRHYLRRCQDLSARQIPVRRMLHYSLSQASW